MNEKDTRQVRIEFRFAGDWKGSGLFPREQVTDRRQIAFVLCQDVITPPRIPNQLTGSLGIEGEFDRKLDLDALAGEAVAKLSLPAAELQKPLSVFGKGSDEFLTPIEVAILCLH